MIAVAVSLLFALYVLGPDAFSRFVIGLTVPRRAVVLTRSEEISRALIWAAISFFFAYVWCRAGGAWADVWRPEAFRTCFAGLYSERFFEAHQDVWFGSLHQVLVANFRLLWRLYFCVLLLSITLTLLTHFYGIVRDRLPDWGWLKNGFAALVLPRVAQWHVYLSRLLLGDRRLFISLDILTKSDKLYQGELAEKALAGDGTLVSVTLAAPKRFDRVAYVKAKEAGEAPAAEAFWKPIPTNMFVVMGSDINTINLRYLPRDRSVRGLKSGSPDLTDLLKMIAEQVKAAQAQAAEMPVVKINEDLT